MFAHCVFRAIRPIIIRMPSKHRILRSMHCIVDGVVAFGVLRSFLGRLVSMHHLCVFFDAKPRKNLAALPVSHGLLGSGEFDRSANTHRWVRPVAAGSCACVLCLCLCPKPRRCLDSFVLLQADCNSTRGPTVIRSNNSRRPILIRIPFCSAE